MKEEVEIKEGIDIHAVWQIISQHKWIVLSVFLLFTSIVSYYSLSKPTLYRSSAILFYDKSSSNPVAELLGGKGGGGYDSPIDFGYYEILLQTDLFNKRFRDAVMADLAKTRDAAYINQISNQISASQISLKPYKEKPQFIEIAALSYDSFLVRKLIEVCTDQLKKRATEIDHEGLQNSIYFIDEQIEITRTNLEKAEIDLQSLKKRSDISSKENEGPLNRIILMKDKLSELETQIQIRNANLSSFSAQLDSIQRRVSGTSNGSVQSSPEESRIKNEIELLTYQKAGIFEKMGNDAYNNSEVKRIDERLADLRNQYYSILSSASSKGETSLGGDQTQLWKNIFEKKNSEEIEYILLKGQARLYTGLIKNFEIKNPNVFQDAIDINKLVRLKQIYEETLNSLIRQKESFSIQFYGNTGDLKIIDPAKEPSAIYNKVFTNIIVGSVLGLLIGIALAFGFEYLDNTIKTVESISSITNIPIIGKIPPIDIGSGGELVTEKVRKRFSTKAQVEPETDRNTLRKRAMISQFSPRSFVSERYRALRTNIQFANIDTPIRSILIGSSGPGEGKTTTAVNLGISFADMGHRVCLVDADLRKPKHHILFEINESPGLCDVVLQNLDVDSVIQSTSVKNLSVLSVGANAQNHTEIFSSIRMSFLMKELEKKFDLIIYDTPPVLLLTDSIILSSRVDAVILIVKYSFTQKQYLHGAILALKAVHANLMGLVLNDYADERKNYYQYAYDSYYINPSGEKKAAAK